MAAFINLLKNQYPLFIFTPHALVHLNHAYLTSDVTLREIFLLLFCFLCATLAFSPDTRSHETKCNISSYNFLCSNYKPQKQTLVFLICRLPGSSRDIRGSLPSRLSPSFSQVTVGSGSPDARQPRRAWPPTPTV